MDDSKSIYDDSIFSGDDIYVNDKVAISDEERARFDKFEAMLKEVDNTLDFQNPMVAEYFGKMIDIAWDENPDVADCSKPTLADFITLLRFMDEKYCHPLVGYTPGVNFPLKRNPSTGPLSKPDFTGPGGVSISFEDMSQAFRQAQEAWQAAKPSVDAARDLINKVINRDARGGTRGVDDGDGGVTTQNYVGGSRFNPSGLSLAARPVDVKLDTGIGVTNFPRFYKDGKDETAPLVIKSVNMYLPDDQRQVDCDPYVVDFVKGPVTKDLLANIVSRARYNNAINTTVTYKKIVALYNTLSFALAAQCFLDNVIAYQNNTDNRNKGMQLLYNAITPTDFLELDTLRQELERICIPPTLYEIIHGLFAPYKQSHLPGSPLMMLCPWRFKAVDNLPFTELDDTNASIIQRAREGLNKTFMNDWNGLLAQTNQTWTKPNIRGYTGVPYVDPNYTTMFTNLQYWATKESTTTPGSHDTVYVPNIASDTSPWKFNFHTDAPDGGLLALLSVRDTSVTSGYGEYAPGLGAIQHYRYGDDATLNLVETIGSGYSHLSGTAGARKRSSCLVYLGDGSAGVTTSPGFYPAEFATRVMALTGNTYAVNSGTASPHAFQKFGTTPAENTYKEGFRYTVKQFIEWLCYKDFADGGRSTSGNMTPRPYRNRGNSRGSSKAKMAKSDKMDKDEV